MPTDPGAPGVTPPSEFTPGEAQRRLNLAMLRLGVPFAECARLVHYDPEASTAYWRHDRRTGEESIGVGPAMLALPTAQLEMVLRHEILHRSVYNGLREVLDHPQLANIVLDICINWLLARAYPQPMRALSEAVYGDLPPDSLVQLANVVAPRSRLPDALYSIYTEIWGRRDVDATGLNPSALYSRLRRLPELRYVLVPWGRPEDGPGIPWPGGDMGRVAGKVWDDLREGMPIQGGMAARLAEYSATPAVLNTQSISAFVRRLRIRRVASAVRQVVLSELEAHAVTEPYPLWPTRAGLVWLSTGLTDLTGRYRNLQLRNAGRRLALGLYFDVSLSMVSKFPVVAAIARELGEYPLKIRSFDSRLREVDLSALQAGQILGGGGTDFELPIQDFLDDRDLLAALLVTDGEGTVGRAVAHALRHERRELSVVYLLSGNQSVPAGGLADAASHHMVFRVPEAA